MFEYVGVDLKIGNEMYYKNDGINEIIILIFEVQKVIVGYYDLKVEGGLINFVKWKFIDFNLILIYLLGGKVVDYVIWLYDNGGIYMFYGVVFLYYKLEDMWKQEGDNVKLLKFKYGNLCVLLLCWLMFIDYFCLKNLLLGFFVFKGLLFKMGIFKVRVYFFVNNLLIWKLKDLLVDFEMLVDGLCIFEMFVLRIYIFGFEIGF